MFLLPDMIPIFTDPESKKDSLNPIPFEIIVTLLLTKSEVSIMKKVLVALAVITMFLMSCNRGISPYQAANGKAGKCGRNFIR